MPHRSFENSDSTIRGARFGFLVRNHHAGIILVGMFALSVSGIFRHGFPDPWPLGLWGGGGLWVLGSLLVRYLRRATTNRWYQIEAATLLLLSVNALTQSSGGLNSAFALLYVFVILWTALLFDLAVNTVTLSGVLVLEGSTLLIDPPQDLESSIRAFIWGLALCLIPILVKAYLRVELREKEDLRTEVIRFKTSAQAFNPSKESERSHRVWPLTPDEREKRVAPVHLRFDRAIENLFWLFKEAVEQVHHCVLFMPEENGDRFRLHKCVGGDLREILPSSVVSEGEGLIGFALKERRLYRVGHLSSGPDALGYASPDPPIQSLMVNTLIQDGRVEGIVVVDSLRPVAFNEEEEDLFLRLCQQVLEAVENRREHQSIQNRALELSTLVAVGESLGSKLELDHRLKTMADKIKEVIPFDHCLIFLVDLGERCAELKVARGFSDDRLIGQVVPLYEGYLALVVKLRTPIIKVDLHKRDLGRKVFPEGSGIELKPASFLGLPMIVQDRVIGIFAIASQRPRAFDEQHKEFLRMLCSQAAISIADAKLHDEVNRMATTDGLTGVTNHRRFQERLNDEVERQARESGRFSLLMVDVDHFKNINDRFGHPAGDHVLRQVASILVKTVRKVDVVARYGGEEFSVVLLNSGPKESYQLAERVRRAVEGLEIVIGGQNLKVTISLGMAVYPDDALDRQTLIELADRALYAAKQNGRNQTCLYSRIQP